MQYQSRGKSQAGSAAGVLVLCALLLGIDLLVPCHAGITEPNTVFYGRVINRTSGQEYVMTNGLISWVITRADGSSVSLNTSIVLFRTGEFLYRLDVPHEAFSSGLEIASNTVPLTIQASTCSHFQISVDGVAASIIAPGSALFSVAQSTRAATYRLDLELGNSLADSDRDGIPDWWANRYGVDDPNADPDGDGWTNLQEFRRGTNPNRDDRSPDLLTRELFVYCDGISGLILRGTDADSNPASLAYGLTSVPAAGTLYLRSSVLGVTNLGSALEVGSGFTQEDVNNGRLVFVHAGASNLTSTSFSVTLRDENAGRPGTNVVVKLSFYRPSYPEPTMQMAAALAAAPTGAQILPDLSPGQQQLTLNYFLSRDQGYVIWDASRAASAQKISTGGSITTNQYSQIVAAGGQDRKHLLAGGYSDDTLTGGMEKDIFIGGHGNDVLRGNGGPDLFLLTSASDGNDVILDFNSAEGDTIDISRVLQGSSTYLSNYVRVTSVGTNVYLNLDVQGLGGAYADMVITLAGLSSAQADLRTWVDNGNLVAGNKTLAPRISIAPTIASASQNGPVSGLLTLTRSGNVGSSIAVNIYVAGSARAGIDYDLTSEQSSFVSAQNWQVNFLPGQKTVQVPINPFGTVMGGTKVAQVTVLGGSGYELGSPTTAAVTIDDLLPQITIEALSPPIAIVGDQTPGYFLITRGGLINQSVLVRLTASGTATRGTDYDGVPSFINLNAGDTTALITVTPRTTAVLSNGMEFVQVSIQTNAAYRIRTPSVARVAIVDQMLSFALWQQRYFPGSTESWLSFASADPGATGIKNLYRYAFGLNPQSPGTSTGIPAYRVLDGHLTVSFRRPVAVSDLEYVVEVSDDMVRWRSSIQDIEAVSIGNTNDLENISFRSKKTVSETPWQFMRVRVIHP